PTTIFTLRGEELPPSLLLSSTPLFSSFPPFSKIEGFPYLSSFCKDFPPLITGGCISTSDLHLRFSIRSLPPFFL
ncbi:unnamed protein product, partial [Prunus brigantina]